MTTGEAAGRRPGRSRWMPRASELRRLSLRGYALAFGAVILALTAIAVHLKAPTTPDEKKASSLPAPVTAMRNAWETRLPPDRPSEGSADREAAPLNAGYRREVTRPRPVADLSLKPGVSADDSSPSTGTGSPESLPDGSPGPAPAGPRRREERTARPETFRMPRERAPAVVSEISPTVAAARPPVPIPKLFAPYGRLLACVLVETLDSAAARSEPILALAARDLDWNGRVIIPANTEGFGFAAAQPVIDARGVGRLVDTGEWTLVLPAAPGMRKGGELRVKGRALDRREGQALADGSPLTWGIDDGAAGLIGYTLSTLDDQELRLFAASAIGGAAQGVATLAERQQAPLALLGAPGGAQAAGAAAGTIASAAAGQGIAETMNQFAAHIRQEIARRGVYVRVPAGKEFYLFIEQNLDPSTAVAGATVPSLPK